MIDILFNLFEGNWMLISFLAGLIGGEELIFVFSILSANGLLPFWGMFFFMTIGVYLSDIIVFFIGRMQLVHNFSRLESLSKVYQKIDFLITRWSKNKVFLALLYTKFIYGARVLALLHLGIKKTPIIKFLVADFLVVLIWISIVIPIGWFGGSSVKFIFDLIRNVQLSIIVAIIFFLIFLFVKSWLSKRLVGMRKELN